MGSDSKETFAERLLGVSSSVERVREMMNLRRDRIRSAVDNVEKTAQVMDVSDDYDLPLSEAEDTQGSYSTPVSYELHEKPSISPDIDSARDNLNNVIQRIEDAETAV